MPGLREEITKTFQRLSRRSDPSSGQTLPSRTPPRGRPPAWEVAETVVKPDSREGQQLGSYRILKRLGFGGMGHVYLALDTRLGRHVALKFLPPALTSDEDLLRRLKQEARTASALNHPNILTIHEIDQIEGDHFIASEFVEGVTLRSALARRLINASTAVDIATQVASALMAAHAAGVVHRDLKPGNIMIRPDGYVKVIDFGIAKNFRAGGNASDTFTRPGAVVGTVDYMSPEQARGEALDERTDLWSLGVILYEMVASERPFSGETESHVIVAILDHVVKPLAGLRSLPPGLASVISRALEKSREKRYQTAGEMLEELHQISSASAVRSKFRAAAVSSRYSPTLRRLLLPIAAVLLILLAAYVWWTLRGSDWFQIESVRQLTFTGRTSGAAISPDGNYLAFVSGDPGGEATLFVKQVESASEEIKIPPRKTQYRGLTFSPDSKYIFETEKDDTLLGKLYAVPILGNRPAVPLVTDVDGPVSFSPAGDRFAFVRRKPGDGTHPSESILAIAKRDDPHVRDLVSFKNAALLRRIAWSPRGNLIAAFVAQGAGDNAAPELDLISVDSGHIRTLFPRWGIVGQLAWLPSGRILLVSAASGTEGVNQAQIREVDVNTGAIRDLTKDLAGYTSLSLSADGSQLAAIKVETHASVWVSLPYNFAAGRTTSAEAAVQPSVAWSGEDHLVLNSNRGGFPNVWLFDINSQTRASVTEEAHVEKEAVAIPGTHSVVFSSNRSGQFHIWKFDPEENRFQQLTTGPTFDESPTVTFDGKWVVYTAWSSNVPHLRKVSADGAEDQQIGSYPARDPQISPDGKQIACLIETEGASSSMTVAIVPFDGTAAAVPIAGVSLPVRWSPAGDALTTIRTDAQGVSNVWAVPLNHSNPYQITRFNEDSVISFAWSPRGDRLACMRARLDSDVMLFKGQKH